MHLIDIPLFKALINIFISEFNNMYYFAWRISDHYLRHQNFIYMLISNPVEIITMSYT
jgi:hypothetical protein